MPDDSQILRLRVIYAFFMQDHDGGFSVFGPVGKMDLRRRNTGSVLKESLRHCLHHIDTVNDFFKIIVRVFCMHGRHFGKRSLHHLVHGLL